MNSEKVWLKKKKKKVQRRFSVAAGLHDDSVRKRNLNQCAQTQVDNVFPLGPAINKANVLRSVICSSKELCNDKFCQVAEQSGPGPVLAFSVINFSAVSRFPSPLTKLP